MLRVSPAKKKNPTQAKGPKKNSCLEFRLQKKKSYTSKGPKKKFLQAENPPPPSPHHFSNGGSLI